MEVGIGRFLSVIVVAVVGFLGGVTISFTREVREAFAHSKYLHCYIIVIMNHEMLTLFFA